MHIFRPHPRSPWRVIIGKTTIMAYLTPLWTCFLAFPLQALCNFDADSPPHHFFNAFLLRPRELQISAAGNFKLGITDQLELGVQSLGYAKKSPYWNIAVKHKMFSMTNYQTSFNSHSFFFQTNAGHQLLSAHGIVTSRFLFENHNLNFGILDGFALSYNHDSKTSLHLITPLLGYDAVMSKRWALSFTFLRPVYADEQEESNRFGLNNRSLDFSQGDSHPTLAMATTTFSWSRFNLELGCVYLSYGSAQFLPYANAFWRLHG